MNKQTKKDNKPSHVFNREGSEIHEANEGSRHTRSNRALQFLKKSNSGGSRKRSGPGRGDTGRTVLYNGSRDLIPLPMYHTEPGEMACKPSKCFMDDIFSSYGSDKLSSFMSGSQLSKLSFKSSLTSETETCPRLTEAPATFEEPRKTDTATEASLDEIVDICLTETDTIFLLDISSTLVLVAADDAEAIKEKNIQYPKLCRMQLGSNKYVARAMQTFSGALKQKKIQCDNIAMDDKGTVATVWDIYDSICNQAERSARIVDTIKSQNKRGNKSSFCSFCSSVSTDPQEILLLKTFQSSLVIMEKTILANIFQSKFAAYRGQPVIEDPDSMMKPEKEEQSKGDEESPSTPALEPLWAFSCKITKGCKINSMVWNKKNPDILAVGYGDFGSEDNSLSFICCWSLKNPVWPERVFHCHSCVTSLDFSASHPSQLAVGMFDGTVAIYDVQCRGDGACIANSSKCLRKHIVPVWQVIWTKQNIRVAGVEREEALVSVSADGRISKWHRSGNCLDCIDLMNIGRFKLKVSHKFLQSLTPGFCIDFHPINHDIYLVGTGAGLIYLCSVSNIFNYLLKTYSTHSPVNHIEWSPFSPEVFLSCSSDWTIQLWEKGQSVPILSFTSTPAAVYTAKWSPNWPTVFAAINEHQLEIWNLNSNILFPTICHCSAPGVEMTTLLFTKGTDCVLVGDSNGQLTVYILKNLKAGEGKQVDNFEHIIKSWRMNQKAAEPLVCTTTVIDF